MRKRLRHNAVVLLAILACLCVASVVYGNSGDGVDYDGYEDINATGETLGDGRPKYTGKTPESLKENFDTHSAAGKLQMSANV